jgi:hypothetical protein
VSDEVIAEALDAWQQGNQEIAVEKLKPLADEGNSAGLLLISWFLGQMGPPRIWEGLQYARRATEEGDPWTLQWYFAHLVDDPDPTKRALAAELVSIHPFGAYNANDPLGRAVQFAQQGDTPNAVAMVKAAAGPHPWPQLPDADEIKQRVGQLNQAAVSVRETQESAEAAIRVAESDVKEKEEDFKTRASTLTELLDNLTNAQSQSHFEERAETYAVESNKAWNLGVTILAVAAGAALLPVLLNYLGFRELSGQSNVSAHLGLVAALAALAGVVLARARNRDRDRQRNSDLSVALKTMFAYSEQIENQEAKERFKHDMGRLVLETFLRQKAPGDDGSRSILSEITDSGPRHSEEPSS